MRTTHHIRRLLAIIVSVLAGATVALSRAAGDDTAPLGSDRLVHHFDFDERDDGNLEDVPKFWVRFTSKDFPRYTTGMIDTNAGHLSSPAFRLDAQGRNIAYRYTGPEIPVSNANDYLVVGYVRGRKLENARAALSAYYLDFDRTPIAATQRFSRLIATHDQDHEDDEWQRVEVLLPGGGADVRWIGVTVWIVHPDVWQTGPRPRRHIENRDVEAAAWFDDIKIYRLPRVSIETSVPGNVFTDGSMASLSVTVTDADNVGLRTTLEVIDVFGRTVRTADIPIQGGRAPVPTRLEIGASDNGLYRAHVRVRTADRILADRMLVFAILNPIDQDRQMGDSVYGVVLETADRADPLVELALLEALKVGAIKIPIWSGSADIPDLIDSAAATDTLLYELLKARVEVTGVFDGPPSDLVRAAGAYQRSLLTMLNEDPMAWNKHLIRVFAPYASIFRSWQIGRDGDQSIVADPRLSGAVQKVRAEIEKLTTAPHLTVPGSLSWEPTSEVPIADEVSLALDHSVPLQYISSHVDEYRERGRRVSTIYLQEEPNRVGSMGYYSWWSKRLVYAHNAGVKGIMVPQPWHTRTSGVDVVTEPAEEFVLLHTVSTMLGGAVPGEPVYIAPGVTALSFSDGENTTLALWDDNAGPQGRDHEIQLGSATRQVDMWGRATELGLTDDGRRRVHLNSQPSFVSGVEPWLIELRTQVKLIPDFLEFSIDVHKNNLEIVNPLPETLNGYVTVVSPGPWNVRPRKFQIAIPPHGKLVKSLEIRYGRDAIAGSGQVRVELDLDTHPPRRLVVPLVLNLGLREIDAWGHLVISGDRLIVRHHITNRSEETLNMRAFAIAPGRLRQARLLTQFKPGSTRTLEYHFKNVEALAGRHVRLQLRDLESPRMHNIQVDVQ